MARLVPGFVLFAAIIGFGKAATSQVFRVDNVHLDSFDALLRVVTKPATSVAGSLWYVYVLLQFQLVFPLVSKLFHKSLPGVLAFSVALQLASLSLALPPLFALSFLSILIWPGAGSKTLIGICSLPALYAFVVSFRASRDQTILLMLGEYAFSVYLMNTLFIGITKGVLQNFLSWDDTNFLLFFPTLLTVGVIGPVVLHRYALARIPYLGKITK